MYFFIHKIFKSNQPFYGYLHDAMTATFLISNTAFDRFQNWLMVVVLMLTNQIHAFKLTN